MLHPNNAYGRWAAAQGLIPGSAESLLAEAAWKAAREHPIKQLELVASNLDKGMGKSLQKFQARAIREHIEEIE